MNGGFAMGVAGLLPFVRLHGKRKEAEMQEIMAPVDYEQDDVSYVSDPYCPKGSNMCE